jgi:curved DNA-binding protein
MAVQFQEYYETLGVGRTASEAQISKAYRKLARKYHPDVSKEKGAEEKFKQIAEAYAVLKDPEKRKKYDALGSNWQSGEDFTPPPGWQECHSHYHDGSRRAEKLGSPAAGGDFSDFCNVLVGRILGSGFGRPNSRSGRGAWSTRSQAQEADITISLQEAYRGATRNIVLQTMEHSPDGTFRPVSREYEVKIPAGVSEGSRIRLTKQGGVPPGGREPADVFLRVQIAPHPIFKFDDRVFMLSASHPVSCARSKVDVPTLDGMVKMTYPSHAGWKTLSLRGVSTDRRRTGDLYATVRSLFPSDPKERELFKNYRRRPRSIRAWSQRLSKVDSSSAVVAFLLVSP